MAKTEQALDIMHEAGILCCMLLFVISGALLMLRYANDGDALPIFGGFTSKLHNSGPQGATTPSLPGNN